MRRLSLDHLQTFADVVELGSFSAAAERLNLSQPAVSQQIRELERRLGAVLIERVGRKARPSVAGEELLTHAARIDAAVHAAVEAVTRHGEAALGRVRIGTGATACIFLLPPALSSSTCAVSCISHARGCIVRPPNGDNTSTRSYPAARSAFSLRR